MYKYIYVCMYPKSVSILKRTDYPVDNYGRFMGESASVCGRPSILRA